MVGIGAVGLFIVPFGYCSCVVAGRADEQKDEWMTRKGEVTMKADPSEGYFQYSSGSRAWSYPKPSTLFLFVSNLVRSRM